MVFNNILLRRHIRQGSIVIRYIFVSVFTLSIVLWSRHRPLDYWYILSAIWKTEQNRKLKIVHHQKIPLFIIFWTTGESFFRNMKSIEVLETSLELVWQIQRWLRSSTEYMPEWVTINCKAHSKSETSRKLNNHMVVNHRTVITRLILLLLLLWLISRNK